MLLQSNINNTRSDVAHLIRVLVEICARDREPACRTAARPNAPAFEARVKSLMTDVPDLPNFSRFHDAFRERRRARHTEGDMRAAFFGAYDAAGCEYVPLVGSRDRPSG